MKPILKKISYWRRLKGLSQAAVAKKLRLTRGAYIEIEKGNNELKFVTLEKIAKILGVSVITIVDKEPAEWEKIIADRNRKIIELQKQLIDLLTGTKPTKNTKR